MKSKFLLTAILFASVLTAKAQINYGVRAGINFSNQTATGAGLTFSNTAKVGLNVGAGVEFELSEKFAIQPELAFSSMVSEGTEIELDMFGNEANVSAINNTLNYISIPMLIKYRVANFSFGVGPQFGVLLSAKSKSQGASAMDFSDSIKKTDFSGVSFTEYTFADKVVLGVRYQLGLSNIAKNTTDDALFEGKLTNNAFQILLGYKF